MGTTSSSSGTFGCSRTPIHKMSNNASDTIGSVKNIDGACNIDMSGMSKYIPDNGEYSVADKGSGCEYQGGSYDLCPGSALWGYRGRYKRDSYKADNTQCCLKNQTVIGNLTCDPKYRSNTGDDCVALLANYCSDNSTFSSSDDCKSFCQNQVSAGKSTCDTIYDNYCKSSYGASDPKCSCILNADSITQQLDQLGVYGVDAVCSGYPSCASTKSPYLKNSMYQTSQHCPSICMATNKGIVITDNTNTQINLTASCSLDTPAGQGIAEGNTDTSDSSVTQISNSETTSFADDPLGWAEENWMISGGIVLIIIIIIGVILFLV